MINRWSTNCSIWIAHRFITAKQFDSKGHDFCGFCLKTIHWLKFWKSSTPSISIPIFCANHAGSYSNAFTTGDTTNILCKWVEWAMQGLATHWWYQIGHAFPKVAALPLSVGHSEFGVMFLRTPDSCWGWPAAPPPPPSHDDDDDDHHHHHHHILVHIVLCFHSNSLLCICTYESTQITIITFILHV